MNNDYHCLSYILAWLHPRFNLVNCCIKLSRNVISVIAHRFDKMSNLIWEQLSWSSKLWIAWPLWHHFRSAKYNPWTISSLWKCRIGNVCSFNIDTHIINIHSFFGNNMCTKCEPVFWMTLPLPPCLTCVLDLSQFYTWEGL